MITFNKNMLQNLFKSNSEILKISEGIVDLEKDIFSYSKDKNLDVIEVIELPSTLQDVEQIIESDLYNLKCIVVNPDNTKFQSINGVLYSKDGKELIKFPPARTGKFVVPSQVEKICSSAFLLSEIEEVVLPPNLKYIDKEAFCKCDKLSFIEIPDTVETIEDRAFYMCELENIIILPKQLSKLGVMAFSSQVESKSNSIYQTDENGNLFNRDRNSLILITNENPMISLKGDYEIESFAGRNQKVINLDGNFYIREQAFENCEYLEIKGFPYIERNAFSENLRTLKINNQIVNFSSRMKLIDFFSFRDKYIIEYYTNAGYRLRIIEKKEFYEEPNFDEIRNYTRCRNNFFPVIVRNIMDESYEKDNTFLTIDEQSEMDVLVENETVLELHNFRRLVELVKKAKYCIEDFYDLETGDFVKEIRPVKGNKYFNFFVRQIFDKESILNENKSEFLDFLYDFFEEYAYQLTGKTTTISYIDAFGGTRGEFLPVDDEILINKASIRKFDLPGIFFTIYHEAAHTSQAFQLELDIMEYKHYLMLKEKILEEYYSDSEDSNIPKMVDSFYDDNYEIELSELDADREGLKIYRTSLELWGFSNEKIENILEETRKSFGIDVLEQTEAKSEEKHFGKKKININKLFENSLPEILIENDDTLNENGVLLIEFNEDGTSKPKIQILEAFADFIQNDSIKKSEKVKGLDLYFGILIKDNTLLSKEQIIREYKAFEEYKTENILVQKMQEAYLEKLNQMMRTLVTNQLHIVTTTQMNDDKEIRNFNFSMTLKRKKNRIQEINTFNQRIKSLKEENGFEEECKG